MTHTIDLDGYFARIGYAGPRLPTLETLRAIHARHAETIAFENLDPLLGMPIRLDGASLERKLVRDRRGGYCYEQNLLLRHVLDALGFRVTGLAARVLWNAPQRATVTPRSHMLLHIELDGQALIADVGFGGQTLTGPLRLVPDIEQPTPHEPFRIVAVGDEYLLQSKVGDAWTALYRFDLQEQFRVDYEIASYYLSTNPKSFFLSALLAARSDAGHRHALFNNHYAVHHADGRTERRIVTSAAEIRGLLQGTFGLNLPETPQLDSVLGWFAAHPPEPA
jgi:N-hydroxyarylamine O-acetyltransferase